MKTSTEQVEEIEEIEEIEQTQQDINTPVTVSTEDILFGGSLTDLYSVEDEKDEVAEELKKEIVKNKYFYLKNQNCWIISLKSKDLFKRFRKDKEFIGNKFKDALRSESKIALLTQVVNERLELKTIGKYLFYREVYLTTRTNKSILKLFSTYIGGNETRFYLSEKENVNYFRWKFLVHKNRLVYVTDLLESNFNISAETVKNIKNYDDVLNYLLNINNTNNNLKKNVIKKEN